MNKGYDFESMKGQKNPYLRQLKRSVVRTRKNDPRAMPEKNFHRQSAEDAAEGNKATD